MREKIYAFIMILLLFCLSFTPVPIAAQEAQPSAIYILDEADVLNASTEESLNNYAKAISNAYGVNVVLCITNKAGDGGVYEYAKKTYEEHFGAERGFIAVADESGYWNIYQAAELNGIITEDELNTVFAAYDKSDYYSDGVMGYLDASRTLIEKEVKAGTLKVQPKSEEATAQEKPSEEAALGTVPAERLLPRLVDKANLLTGEEEESLLKKLDEISERQQLDVVIVTVEGLEGKTPTAYADDFFDYNGFGFGKDHDGVLLLLSMKDRDWAISTTGYGITAFTDAGQKYITDTILPDLGSGNYSDAFTTFANMCDDYINHAKADNPYDRGHLPEKSDEPSTVPLVWIVIDAVAALIIAAVTVYLKNRRLSTVKVQYAAEDYTRPGSMRLTNNSDRFIREVTTCREIHNDSSSGGGSSTHVSSSGTIHGGSSGKF